MFLFILDRALNILTLNTFTFRQIIPSTQCPFSVTYTPFIFNNSRRHGSQHQAGLSVLTILHSFEKREQTEKVEAMPAGALGMLSLEWGVGVQGKWNRGRLGVGVNKRSRVWMVGGCLGMCAMEDFPT